MEDLVGVCLFWCGGFRGFVFLWGFFSVFFLFGWLVGFGGFVCVVASKKSWSLVQNTFPRNNNKRLRDASSPDWPEPEKFVKITEIYSVLPVPNS